MNASSLGEKAIELQGSMTQYSCLEEVIKGDWGSMQSIKSTAKTIELTALFLIMLWHLRVSHSSPIKMPSFFGLDFD